MKEEQQNLLARRLRSAIEEQPEIETLRNLLLRIGGVELVAPPKPDDDTPRLIQAGFVMAGPVRHDPMERRGCHENASRLWLSKDHELVGVGTGYALSEDGLWRQHSWGVRRDGIVETTTVRVKYFGILLQGNDADAFAECNL